MPTFVLLWPYLLRRCAMPAGSVSIRVGALDSGQCVRLSSLQSAVHRRAQAASLPCVWRAVLQPLRAQAPESWCIPRRCCASVGQRPAMLCHLLRHEGTTSQLKPRPPPFKTHTVLSAGDTLCTSNVCGVGPDPMACVWVFGKGRGFWGD